MLFEVSMEISIALISLDLPCLAKQKFRTSSGPKLRLRLILIFMITKFSFDFSAEKAKEKASDKNNKSGFVMNKQARVVEEDEIPNKFKKSFKKASPPAPKVRTNMRKTLQGGFLTVPPDLQN